VSSDASPPRPNWPGGENREVKPGALGPLALPPEQYWEERLGRDFSLGGVGHVGLGRAFNEWAYRARRVAVRRTLLRHGIRANRSEVLEVGFGTGYFVELWLELGAQSVVGLDITHRAVEALSARFPRQRFFRQDIAASDCPRFGAFDIVTAFDVLFHLLDEAAFQRAIANLCRQLKPGGYLLVTDIFSSSSALKGPTQHSRPLPVYRELLGAQDVRVALVRPIFFTMSSPVDVSGPRARQACRAFWRGLSLVLEKAPVVGHLLGPLCYLVDSMLQRTPLRGPSVKLLVARADP
jgi:SAM-dependent methyltransferase